MKKDRSELAGYLFTHEKNCAQSVLLAFADKLNISDQHAFAMAAGFGGGIAKSGEVCGAVSGATMVLGLMLGTPGENPKKAKEIVEAKVQRFLQEFVSRNKSLICREIIDGVDLKTPEGQKKWADKNMKEYNCLPAVQTAVEILNDLV